MSRLAGVSRCQPSSGLFNSVFLLKCSSYLASHGKMVGAIKEDIY